MMVLSVLLKIIKERISMPMPTLPQSQRARVPYNISLSKIGLQ
jgi:hypothetical protein